HSQGRSYSGACDLGSVLEFIEKNIVNDQPLIWIDDIELWNHPDHPLGTNVRRLCDFIDRFSNKAFIMVSMGNWTSAHLQRTHQIHKVFQAGINLDQMSQRDILDAIIIRHGATHKQLVDKELKPVTAPQFQKMVRQVAGQTSYNIGEALYQWVVGIDAISEEEVQFKRSVLNGLPNFLNADTAILLSTLLLLKETDDYRLRKLFGQAWNEKYNLLTQRLMGIGLVQRKGEGRLEINPVVANEVGRLLDSEGYLSFRNN
ncbi:MAG: hypothetical protein AAFO94_13200, partial [Bacteroidota bacterium]